MGISITSSSIGLCHLAELDEEIALASADVQLLSNFSQTIELATRELTEATSEYQKIFAPRLERIVNSGLEQISAGRYRQVKIDPNSLEIQVLAPERKEWVEAKHFSTGTRDMIYLLLRVGIAQLMSTSGEKLPILLDDPLVEFDEKRQKAALDYIEKLARQTQVFLFTKDFSIMNMFTIDKRPELLCKVIELKAP